MKTISTIIIVFLLLLTINTRAAKFEVTKANSEGFTVTLESVVDNNDSSFTIVLRVANNGRNAFTCKELSGFAIEAIPGTYANVGLNVVAGNVAYTSYIAGPSLRFLPFQGFKFEGISDIGRVKAGTFKVSYIISGKLQDQRVACNMGTDSWIVRFNVKDFENVRDLNKTQDNITLKADDLNVSYNTKITKSSEKEINTKSENDFITTVFETLSSENPTTSKN